MFSNHKGEHKWIEKMLTIENIQGNAEMAVENKQIIIPHAFSSSDKIDAGAKGIINAESAEGMFYARFRKLDAVLKNQGRKAKYRHHRRQKEIRRVCHGQKGEIVVILRTADLRSRRSIPAAEPAQYDQTSIVRQE